MSDRDPKRIAKLEPREKPEAKHMLEEIRESLADKVSRDELKEGL